MFGATRAAWTHCSYKVVCQRRVDFFLALLRLTVFLVTSLACIFLFLLRCAVRKLMEIKQGVPSLLSAVYSYSPRCSPTHLQQFTTQQPPLISKTHVPWIQLKLRLPQEALNDHAFRVWLLRVNKRRPSLLMTSLSLSGTFLMILLHCPGVTWVNVIGIYWNP